MKSKFFLLFLTLGVSFTNALNLKTVSKLAFSGIFGLMYISLIMIDEVSKGVPRTQPALYYTYHQNMITQREDSSLPIETTQQYLRSLHFIKKYPTQADYINYCNSTNFLKFTYDRLQQRNMLKSSVLKAIPIFFGSALLFTGINKLLKKILLRL